MDRIAVLDHGYIEPVEFWGSDEAIICAARMSTQKGFNGWGPKHTAECDTRRDETFRHYKGPPQEGIFKCECGGNNPGDEKLLAFMWKNQHSTPFEFAGAVIEIQAPIFVFREWHRHRTQSFSEASARYSPLPDVNYIPTVERLMANAGAANRQASTANGAEPLNVESAEEFRRGAVVAYRALEAAYQMALQIGVPKELARIILPVGRYSRMRASANLRNWLGFLTLRQAPNAQYEIRQYADALHDILAKKFPRTLALFDEGKK